MRIGELAQRLGTSTDTIRYYERAGVLPRAERRDNAYREYGDADVEHLRLLLDLRRLDLPLDDAAQIATWCHSGHCADTRAALPSLIAMRRAEVAERMAGLAALDARLAQLERHLTAGRRVLTVVEPAGAPAAPCCDAAGEVLAGGGGCTCCEP